MLTKINTLNETTKQLQSEYYKNIYLTFLLFYDIKNNAKKFDLLIFSLFRQRIDFLYIF